jgi:hypothetical protein
MRTDSSGKFFAFSVKCTCMTNGSEGDSSERVWWLLTSSDAQAGAWKRRNKPVMSLSQQ